MSEVIEKREWSQWDENNKMNYAIIVEGIDAENNIVTMLMIKSFYKPLGLNYGNRHGYIWIIEYDAGELKVEWIERAYEWNGTYTKTLAEMSIKTDFEELPWFVDMPDLVETVESLGVQKAIDLILDYLRDLFTMAFE
jgi:hypothetical protein